MVRVFSWIAFLVEPKSKNRPADVAHRRTLDTVIDCVEKDGRLTFKVRVVPRASRTEIMGEHDGALRVRIAARPVDGAANEELVRTLAQAFKVARSAIEIIAGQTSKLKTVRVAGVQSTNFSRILPPWKEPD